MFLSRFKKCIVATIATFALCSSLFAAPGSNNALIDPAVVARVSTKMRALNIEVISVSSFAVDGLYEILTDKGIFYISKNLQFLIDGSVYDFDNRMANLSENSLATLRKAKLQAFEKDMIVYKAPNEKHVITVFTDTSCAYCQKLHAEMADYNKLGITVRYLAFPRAGLRSSTAHLMSSIWCADDPKLAMDKAKKGLKVASKTCDNSIKAQYELGVEFGVTGTPALILEDGSLNPGYVPAQRLSDMLDSKFN